MFALTYMVFSTGYLMLFYRSKETTYEAVWDSLGWFPLMIIDLVTDLVKPGFLTRFFLYIATPTTVPIVLTNFYELSILGTFIACSATIMGIMAVVLYRRARLVFFSLANTGFTSVKVRQERYGNQKKKFSKLKVGDYAR